MNWVHVRNLVQAHVLAAEALTAARGYVAVSPRGLQAGRHPQETPGSRAFLPSSRRQAGSTGPRDTWGQGGGFPEHHELVAVTP